MKGVSHTPALVDEVVGFMSGRIEAHLLTEDAYAYLSKRRLIAPDPNTKTCPDCGPVPLPVHMFYKNRSTTSGLSFYCKKHQLIRHKRWRDNSEHYKLRVLPRGKRRKYKHRPYSPKPKAPRSPSIIVIELDEE
jgi:hypothetical protein